MRCPEKRCEDLKQRICTAKICDVVSALTMTRRATISSHMEVDRKTRFRLRTSSAVKWALMSLLLVSAWGSNTGCDSDPSAATTWHGTYSVSDQFGGGSGTVSFFVADNDTIYCFTFSGTQSDFSTPCGNPGTNSFPINGNQFSIPVSTDQGTFLLEGQFTSSTSTSPPATGNIVGPGGSAEVVLTWSAAAVPSKG